MKTFPSMPEPGLTPIREPAGIIANQTGFTGCMTWDPSSAQRYTAQSDGCDAYAGMVHSSWLPLEVGLACKFLNGTSCARRRPIRRRGACVDVFNYADHFFHRGWSSRTTSRVPFKSNCIQIHCDSLPLPPLQAM